jgi:hypothetical protein
MDLNTLGGYGGTSFNLASDVFKKTMREAKVITVRDNKPIEFDSNTGTGTSSSTAASVVTTKAPHRDSSVLADALGIFPYGMEQRSTCEKEQWYAKANHRTIRHVLLRAQRAPADGKTEMKVCVPSIVVDKSPSATALFQEISTRAQGLMTQISSPSFIPSMSTEESAVLFGIQGKIQFAGLNDKGKALYTVKPEKGKVFQQYQMTFQGSNAKLFKQSACGLRTGVGQMQINLLKGVNYQNWKYLKEHHVLMDCQEDNNKIKVYVQVTDTKGTEARTDITTAYSGNSGEDTILELTMAGVDTDNLPPSDSSTEGTNEEESAKASESSSSGVVRRMLSPPTNADVAPVEVSPTTESEITVDGDSLDATTLDTMREEGLAPEIGQEAEYAAKHGFAVAMESGLLILMVIGILLGACFCVAVIGAVIYFVVIKPKKKQSVQPSKQVVQMTAQAYNQPIAQQQQTQYVQQSYVQQPVVMQQPMMVVQPQPMMVVQPVVVMATASGPPVM